MKTDASPPSPDLPAQIPPYAIAERRYYCPVQLTVEALSGKWKPMILWHLVLHDKMRYSEIRQALRTVTHKMLTQSLRELESDGLIDRTIHEVVPPKVEYALSEKGQTLRGIFMAMRDFGETYKSN
jgi:DNA-binding HxlR family transcriptional regulator